MVGIFSKFSVGRAGHRRTQSALDEREVLPPNAELNSAAAATASAPHGIEIAVEFKPVEHPIEPMDSDQPIQCPLPEPSILNDGRLWKERVSATVRRRADLPVMKEGGTALESESAVSKPPRPTQSNRLILPSIHQFVKERRQQPSKCTLPPCFTLFRSLAAFTSTQMPSLKWSRSGMKCPFTDAEPAAVGSPRPACNLSFVGGLAPNSPNPKFEGDYE